MWITFSLIILVTGFASQKLIFEPISLHIGCVVDKDVL